MNKAKQIGCFFLLTLAVAIISTRLTNFVDDDAYIHFRIAENLATHSQPYFNLGEQVMVTSSFVWTWVLALLFLLHLSVPSSVSILNAAIMVGGACLWTRLLYAFSARTPPKHVLGLFVLGYISVLAPSCFGLMETPLAILLLGAAVMLLSQSKPYGWVFMVLAIFTRAEIIVFCGLFAAQIALSGRSSRFSNALWLGLGALGVSWLTWHFFGTLVPHPAIAKQIVFAHSREAVFEKVFYSIIPHLAYPFCGVKGGYSIQVRVVAFASWAWLPGVCFLLGASCHDVRWRELVHNQRCRWLVSILCGGLIVGAAYIVKHVFLHGWYVPLYVIPLIFASYAVLGVSSLWGYGRVLLFSLLPLSSLCILFLTAFGSRHALPDAVTQMTARVQRYLNVGACLYRHFPDARLMTSEIGGLGYGFKGQILDGAGLATPAALKWHPMIVSQQRSGPGIGAIPTAFIDEARPELIVSYPIFVEEFDRSPQVASYQKLVVPAFCGGVDQKLQEGIWGTNVLFVYVRRGMTGGDNVRSIARELDAISW